MELIGGASLRHGFQAIGLAADQLTSALIGRQLAAA
jgi:hypothetical protein